MLAVSRAAEAQDFKKMFEEAAKENSKLINVAAVPAAAGDSAAEAADELAEGLSKTKVEETAAADETKPEAATETAKAE